MSYKVRIRSSIRKRIVAWNLPDSVFVEVLLRLQQELVRDPPSQLARTRQPFDGMTYAFSLVDPGNPLREYAFIFHIVYGQDEERCWSSIAVITCSDFERLLPPANNGQIRASRYADDHAWPLA